MSETIKAILLGIIQGLTEYLPVSSSGHIELGKAILGFNLSEGDNLTFSVILHFGTVLSTLVVFRKDIWSILQGLLPSKDDKNLVKSSWPFAFKIVLSMIPAAIIGLLWEDDIDVLFMNNVLLVGAMLFVTGGLLLLADRASHSNRKLTYRDAAFVGLAQAIALLPGISRSGATIGTSVLLGIERDQAARFSFLMVVPLILGKVAKDLLSGEFNLTQAQALPMFMGFLAAFVVGIVACNWMLSLVKRGKFWYFSIYCFIIGSSALLHYFLA